MQNEEYGEKEIVRLLQSMSGNSIVKKISNSFLQWRIPFIQNSEIVRKIPKPIAKFVPPGSQHYTAYVGPPDQYDLMGATQFRLLCALGLRAQHLLLDFGCGSLRAGRLFIPYLNSGCYYGLEPNKWLIDDAINNELGQGIIDLKKPTFLYHSDYNCSEFQCKFDYILAQSIFSHTGLHLASMILSEFHSHIRGNGVVALTFIHSKDDSSRTGWIYPDCVEYRAETITRLVEDVGFYCTSIPWFHPRQTWYVLSKSPHRIPNIEQQQQLSGVILS